MKTYFSILLIISFLFSCTKKDDDDFRTVKGQILSVVDSSTAISNTKFIIGGTYTTGKPLSQGEGVYSVPLTTDNAGYFNVSINTKNGAFPSIYWGTEMTNTNLVTVVSATSPINDIGKLYTKRP